MRMNEASFYDIRSACFCVISVESIHRIDAGVMPQVRKSESPLGVSLAEWRKAAAAPSAPPPFLLEIVRFAMLLSLIASAGRI